ncbi:MAG: prephenate dehydrogenase/arogenate dehydrogenase family protein [Pirellulales bacterium]|nr:prephenate dehydrogenase/arogenate dehydrogenase family protein [Pirellulales bacterium]
MKRWDTVAIVGVGLIGGSIGLAVRERSMARRVVGIGRSTGSLRVAKRAGTIDAGTTDLARGVAEAELIVVCTPVERIAEQVRACAAACPDAALITDAGSTKAQIVAELGGALPRGVRFVGSHPLAGSEKRGAAEARADLFCRRTVVITPAPQTPPGDVTRLKGFWTALGAKVVTMTPEAHDRAVAATSHLPHFVASALAAATPKEHLALAASGFLDTTRIAAGDPELWTQIFLSNREPVLQAIAAYDAMAGQLRAAIDQGDRRALVRLLNVGKQRRDAVEN